MTAPEFLDFLDLCAECQRIVRPHAALADGPWLHARYWCEPCNRTWSTGWPLVADEPTGGTARHD